MTSSKRNVFYLLKVDYGSRLRHFITQQDQYVNGKIGDLWTNWSVVRYTGLSGVLISDCIDVLQIFCLRYLLLNKVNRW